MSGRRTGDSWRLLAPIFAPLASTMWLMLTERTGSWRARLFSAVLTIRRPQELSLGTRWAITAVYFCLFLFSAFADSG